MAIKFHNLRAMYVNLTRDMLREILTSSYEVCPFCKSVEETRNNDGRIEYFEDCNYKITAK